MAYRVKLNMFEGPMDLLLHLIKKNEVDIYDIPIAAITDEYIRYLDMMKAMNLDLAGEFIVMAATLIHIKSRMLLPIPEEGVTEEEGEDPRAELTRKLLEYQKYKLAAIELNSRTVLGRDVFARGVPFDLSFDMTGESGADDPGLADVSLFDLVAVFRDIIKRLPHPYKIDLTVDRFRIADKINAIMEMLSLEGSLVFKDLFPLTAPKGEIIVTFLAVLELARLLMIKVNQTEDGVIRIRRAFKGESAGVDFGEGGAQAGNTIGEVH
ncbi:MAG: segregation/condensation protein A [Deltaproteobacteria bacterium]|nr:segregation/condensation protein A [Deltaproteobacteria bacterium]